MALFLMAAATIASAQEVTQAEKDRALQYLETTKKVSWKRRKAVRRAVELQTGSGSLVRGASDGAHRGGRRFSAHVGERRR